MHTRQLVAFTAVAAFAAVAACGSSRTASPPASESAASATATTTPVAPRPPAPTSTPITTPPITTPAGVSLPVALVAAGGSLAVVAAGAEQATWDASDARAALDGSAAFRVEAGALVRLDVRTGTPDGRWPLPDGAWHVAVVGSGGRRVVVTDGVVATARTASTRIGVVDVRRDEAPRILTLAGTLEPEALSVDGYQLFVLDHRPTYYRVRVVTLATGAIDDVSGRDKTEPPEDMVGEAVRAVLSPDGNVLATLYRGTNGAHPFVHVLHLADGFAYCADLPAGRYDAIARSADGQTVYAGAAGGPWVALDLREFGERSSDPLPLTTHRTGVPPVPLARAGTAVEGAITVTADPDGLTWWHAGAAVGHIARPVDRLVALVPD